MEENQNNQVPVTPPPPPTPVVPTPPTGPINDVIPTNKPKNQDQLAEPNQSNTPTPAVQTRPAKQKNGLNTAVIVVIVVVILLVGLSVYAYIKSKK